jgi:AcrR family transcriptional regulator
MNKKQVEAAPRRRYSSPTRTAQKEATRQRILNAIADHLASGTFDSLSMEDIARTASVSPATLYRYFPSRPALLDALADDTLFQRLGDLPYPRTPHEIAPIMAQSFVAFDADPAFVRTYFSTDLGRTARTRGRKRRIQAIQAALQPLTERLPESERVAAEAVIAYLASIQAWVTMQDEFSLTGAQVGEAVTWAIDTLLKDLEAREKGGSDDH